MCSGFAHNFYLPTFQQGGSHYPFVTLTGVTMKNQQTICVHGGHFEDTMTGGINTPIFTSSVFRYLDPGKQPYPRYFNTPNQEVVVAKLCELEGAEAGIVFSSGMAAISTTLLSLLKHGDHLVLQGELYGGTHAFICQQLPRLGIEYCFVPKDCQAMEDGITKATKVIYIETPTNPLLGIVDIAALAKMAKRHGITTIIDNTFASPVNQNPIELGVDIVVHSGTKYLGGHSDICCGIALGSEQLIDQVRMTAMDYGGSLNGSTCSLLERSLKTLHLRVSKQTENAAVIAAFLGSCRGIKRVYYPGLKNHPGHEIARQQMRGFGAMVGFELEDNRPTAIDFMRRLQLITPGLSLGGIESTICAPAETSHKKMTAAAREALGISEKLLRFSVGIEHPDDLIADISQALGE